VKMRFDARGGRLRVAALAVCLMTTGTAYAASTPGGQEAGASGAGATMAGAGTSQKVRYGHPVRLSGRVAPAKPGRGVRLEYAPAGRDWRPLKQTTSGTGGGYSFSVRARQSAAYRALADGGGASAGRRVAVVARLAGKATRHVRRGGRVKVRGVLKPGLPGRTVSLQLRSGRRWKTVDRARTARGGSFRAGWRASQTGRFRLRVKFRGDRSSLAVSRVLRGRVNVYRPGLASWYGPGFMGGRTACGGTISSGVKGVAHKTLPCGTRVTFRYRGRSVTAKVIDRGPYSGGREWDLTPATKQALGFPSTGTVWSTR
jgi:peptidoglycan lytic transglycosylase